MTARLIAFEGLDGSGKSTVIRDVAEQLRQAGEDVVLPRMGKHHVSRPTQKIRDLTRDPRNLLLSPRAELALYCAREAQVLDEHVRPALAAGKTVLLDRSLLTPVVLGADGRGLPFDQCQAAAEVAAAGLWPDVTVVLDVHPRTSRIRKRIARAREQAPPDPGRKGLAGSAFKERIAAGYRRIASERGYPLFHTERALPEQVAARVVAHLLRGISPESLEQPEDAIPAWQVDPSLEFDEALAALSEPLALFMTRGLLRGRGLRRDAIDREPALVAWGLDAEDPLRARLLDTEAAHALAGWTRRPLEGPDDLRVRAAEVAPAAVARALTHVEGAEADALRERLAEHAPGDVLASLAGRDDSFAWALRTRLWREGELADRAASLVHCADERAWPLREKLLDKHPLYGIRSMRGSIDPRAHAVLDALAERAPKAVARALTGNGSDFAHRLRERLLETGREVIDSLAGLDDAPSMSLRARVLERWPSTVIGSLMQVPGTPGMQALVDAASRAGAEDLHVKRRLVAMDERDQLPSWRRRGDDEVDE